MIQNNYKYNIHYKYGEDMYILWTYDTLCLVKNTKIK